MILFGITPSTRASDGPFLAFSVIDSMLCISPWIMASTSSLLSLFWIYPFNPKDIAKSLNQCLKPTPWTFPLIIKGKVQNVGFRHWFSDIAITLGLSGYIQNKESKDEVEAIIQGDMQSILSITEKSKNGPEMALVEGVIPNSIISNVRYSGFIVKYEN